MKVTIKQIEKQIDKTVIKAKLFNASQISGDELLASVDKLGKILKAGTKAGLFCSETKMKAKFAILEKELTKANGSLFFTA